MAHYFKNIWSGVSTAFIGMKITFKHLFARKVTIQYPDEKMVMPERARNRLSLEMSRCNGCNSCVLACPVNCITLETVRVSPEDPHQEVHHNGKDRKMWVTRYEIDFAKCCYCGLCTQACPSDAITHTREYEYSEYDRDHLLYKFQTLTPEQVEEKKRLYEEFKKNKQKADASKKDDKAE